MSWTFTHMNLHPFWYTSLVYQRGSCQSPGSPPLLDFLPCYTVPTRVIDRCRGGLGPSLVSSQSPMQRLTCNAHLWPLSMTSSPPQMTVNQNTKHDPVTSIHTRYPQPIILDHVLKPVTPPCPVTSACVITVSMCPWPCIPTHVNDPRSQGISLLRDSRQGL